VATNKSLQINVEGAKALRESLKALGDRALLNKLATNNAEIANEIVRAAQANATTRREDLVAGALKSVKSSGNVSVRLRQLIDVNDKRGLRPVGTGTEFGAYRNRRRLVKNTGGRNTIVRDDEDIDTVIRRVEAQTRFGFDTVRKKARQTWDATPVKVTKVIRGWNGFRPWKSGNNAGYFLFPAIRDNRQKIIDMYMESVQEVWTEHKAA